MGKSNEQGMTPSDRPFSEKVRSNAKFLRDCYENLSQEEAEAIAKKLDECADLLEASRPEAGPSDEDTAMQMLAEWCVMVARNGTSWDDWDEGYKNAAFRDGPLRAKLDAKIKEVAAQQYPPFKWPYFADDSSDMNKGKE